MFYRMFRVSLMVTIGAIVVSALGVAITVGVAGLRGENAMGMRGPGVLRLSGPGSVSDVVARS